MNLKEIYHLSGMPGLRVLAEKVKCSPKYLYQCAAGIKLPSPELAFRLCSADPRLKFEALFEAAQGKAAAKDKLVAQNAS